MNDLEPTGIHLKADACRPDGFFLNGRFTRYAYPFKTIPSPTIRVSRSRESGSLFVCWEARGQRDDTLGSTTAVQQQTTERDCIPDDPPGWWKPHAAD